MRGLDEVEGGLEVGYLSCGLLLVLRETSIECI